ncbi:hypothetical protein ACJJTC_001249 [Scirpophaga incertulas]
MHMVNVDISFGICLEWRANSAGGARGGDNGREFENKVIVEESILTNQLKENNDGNNVEKDKDEENIYEPNETENNPQSDNEQVFNENTAVQAIHVCSRKIEEARISARQMQFTLSKCHKSRTCRNK